MSDATLLKKIADDITHIKIDLEEIKDLVYPPEEKISPILVSAVHESEKHYREGKFRELKKPEEIKKILHILMFTARFTIDFEVDTKFLKKNYALAERVQKKVLEILENPEHYKPLRNILKGKRRAHIGSYVLLYEIENNIIIFHRFLPHDQAYKP